MSSFPCLVRSVTGAGQVRYPLCERLVDRIWRTTWARHPGRNPVIAWDIPKKPEPLPKFLDDRDAARL
jgi:hypothetical protein